MKKVTIDGNSAAAEIAYFLSDIAAIYPITPSSTMAEIVDEKSADGELNAFGERVKVVEMQSEGGASGAVHGAASGGALTTTFTSSQGLLLMIPNMYKIAGELLPTVFHVAARTIATHALSIFGDHSDVMAARQTGFAMLASASVQEAMDMALISHLSTLKSSVPFLHFFDGFRTSHEINTINNLDKDKIVAMLPMDKIAEFRKRGLSSSHPHQQGTSQTPDIFFQNREACNKFYADVPQIVEKTMNEFYKVFGRKYKLFDYIGSPTAENILVVMGSGAETSESTISYLNKKHGGNYGVLKVRLYRPFSVKHLLSALPKTVKRICVLDRCKEPGSAGEPLYKDVCSALLESGKTNIKVVGGRYGLGSFEFNPSMVKAVLDNLTSEKPKNDFTIGITDDVTKTSLKISTEITLDNKGTACKFFGYGGDGTVSANKNSIKIIGNNTNLYGQAFFEYDSKKSGNATITNLRFGDKEIKEPFLPNNLDFVACHNQTYITKFNLTKGLKENGIFLLNTNWNLNDLNTLMPPTLKKEIAKKKIRVYTINASGIANELGLGSKINLIMQSAFFKLIDIIPFNKAKSEMKAYAKQSYGSKGEKILEMNYAAVDSAEKHLQELHYPASWTNAKDSIKAEKQHNEYYKKFIDPIQRLDGDKLPVSSFDVRGFVPTDTAKLEKRGIAEQMPCWLSGKCIQCNMCSFVCPHAAIRPYLTKDLSNKPDSLETLPATAEKDKTFVIQVSPFDCTGCGLCSKICPTKALMMTPMEEAIKEQKINYDYISKQETVKSAVFKPNTVKGSQFNKPYFEFSGACAGCGETPYIKVVSQLFGDRMVVANATGCSSIYGGSSPTCPYAKDPAGRGIAWANSLFEDNAEFGYGIKLSLTIKKKRLEKLLTEVTPLCSAEAQKTIRAYLSATTPETQITLSNQIKKLLPLQKKVSLDKLREIDAVIDSAMDQSVWIIGGDGWAYDIGFGGLDHILASGENINILVLDTEVYSNTGGQASKATPMGAVAKFASKGKLTRKKDLALMATTYKDVYVAKVSMGANMNQFLKAVQEAEAYDGVSLIIAYAPCINHGINLSNSQDAMKKAVETGYWQLFRYNPTLREQGKNPFILDSTPTGEYMDFVKSENRYNSLIKKEPARAEELLQQAKKHAQETFETYKKLSEEE